MEAFHVVAVHGDRCFDCETAVGQWWGNSKSTFIVQSSQTSPRPIFHDYFPKHWTKCSQHHRFAKHQLTQNKASRVWLNSSIRKAKILPLKPKGSAYICVASSRPQICSFLLPVGYINNGSRIFCSKYTT
mgnify:CR=1 FL=1